MTGRAKLREYLESEYKKKTNRSREIFARAEKVMTGGGSHSVRLFRPYPVFVEKASGPFIFDFDGHSYIDYWQGHYANILGHNPEFPDTSYLSGNGYLSSHTGFESIYQIKLAELLISRFGGNDFRVRFTTSGTLAVMYAVMLAQAFTNREFIVKIGGGWHGASPNLLKGVKYHRQTGFKSAESGGVPSSIFKKTIITRFNDSSDLERVINKFGNRVACLVLEPFLGVGGFLPAEPEYLALTRHLTAKYGIVLIYDEIISGFRFCAGGVQKLYGIEADLTALGKIIGGGNAVSAIIGKKDIMSGCLKGNSRQGRVFFEGGTFSAHPEYMRAGLKIVQYLCENEEHVYSRLALTGDKLRKGIESAFSAESVRVLTSGSGNDVVSGSSLFMVHFPKKKTLRLLPEELQNERTSDLEMREEILKLALLINGVNAVHGGGAISLAHSDAEIERTVSAYRESARLFRKFLY